MELLSIDALFVGRCFGTVKGVRRSLPLESIVCFIVCVVVAGALLSLLFKAPPPMLADLLRFDRGPRSRKFLDNIRVYNSMFAFTSMGANIDKNINP